MKIPILVNLENYIRNIKNEIFFLVFDKKKFNIKKYDVIFSFGFSCSTAIFLRDFNLRTFSGPFDWITVPFSKRCDIFLNDFEKFLVKENLDYVGVQETPHLKDRYIDRENRIFFVHDFPYQGNLDETFPEVYEKYQRRINRLTEKIKENKDILMVYMDFSLDEASVASNDEISAFIDAVNKKYNKNSIDFLYIRHNADMKNGEFLINRISENAIVAECFNQSGTSDAISAGNKKIVRKILQFFRLKK